MKKTLILAATALSLAACTSQKDPYQVSLENAIVEQLGEGTKVKIESFQRIDSTTFGKELAYRRKVFDLRLAQNVKLLDKYNRQGLPNSAQGKRGAILHDHEVIDGLAQMAETLGDTLDMIAYYDYKFTGRVSLNGSKAEYRDYYAVITPDGKVYNIDSNLKTLHKPMGHVIPGYVELVQGDDAE